MEAIRAPMGAVRIIGWNSNGWAIGAIIPVCTIPIPADGEKIMTAERWGEGHLAQLRERWGLTRDAFKARGLNDEDAEWASSVTLRKIATLTVVGPVLAEALIADGVAEPVGADEFAAILTDEIAARFASLLKAA